VSGIRILCVHVSVVLFHPGSWWVPVCCGFGSIRQNDHVRFVLVSLFLVCVDRVCGMHVSLPVSLKWRIGLSWDSHSLIHSFFSLSCICRCSFAIVMISVIGSSSLDLELRLRSLLPFLTQTPSLALVLPCLPSSPESRSVTSQYLRAILEAF
jgi:hypothetical protein